MMHECKRILNKEVAGVGLWEANLREDNNEPAGPVFGVIVQEQDAVSDSNTEQSVREQDVDDIAADDAAEHFGHSNAQQTGMNQLEEQAVSDPGDADDVAADGAAEHVDQDDEGRKNTLECRYSK